MKTVVIGGGPAGLIAAIEAAKYDNDVTVLEKMDEIRYTNTNNKILKFIFMTENYMILD